jgi:hypothetical protein
MPNYTYLIVGGGMTAAAAVQGIREADPSGSIGLIRSKGHPPYDRPPLTKGLWKGLLLGPVHLSWSFRKASGEVDGRELPLLARVRLVSRVAPPWAR